MRNERVVTNNKRSEVSEVTSKPNNNERSKVVTNNKRSEVKVYIIYLIGLLLGGATTTACPEASKTSTEASNTGETSPSSLELPPREKPELSFSVRIYELSGAVSEFVLQHEAEFEIEPTQRVEVLANQRLADFRVRLMDAGERVLESDEEVFLEAEATRVNIQLLSALKPTHTLTLWVDGQLSPKISNTQEDSYEDFRANFKVRGEPEKPAEKPKAPSKHSQKGTKTKTKRKKVVRWPGRKKYHRSPGGIGPAAAAGGPPPLSTRAVRVEEKEGWATAPFATR